ncbi:DUF5694 domain-containing protein [uncultured Kordia sp.]|uniref:DUF5694 domain-containing protein n=1 Tax=uncultured Kordia sp. TaxID=507699 RepID=UPI002617BEB1|nr:DUF5694 domain-containing protein [uncultured Kordia sp.]
MKNHIVCLLFLSLLVSCEQKEEIATTNATKKIKVYLLGTFHFAQTDSTYNVLDAKHQQSIEELCDIVVKQKPDKVFIERQPEYEFRNKYDSLFKVYVDTDVLPYRNELYQVGFRVAKRLKHSKVYQCDHPGQYGRYFSAALKYAKEHNQMGYIDASAKGTVLREDDRVDEDSIQKNSSLLDYIKWINSEAVMQTSHASYIVNDPQVGSADYYNYDDDDTLLGAEVTADWYRRNIMIYSKMINQLSYEEDAIFLIIGADHVPILEYLFTANPYFEVIKASSWLSN